MSVESLLEFIVEVRRVVKVVKGGRTFSFSVYAVVGSGDGSVGFGIGKADEVASARQKAVQSAKKNLVRFPIYQSRTVHYDVYGSYGATKVMVRRASPGTGIIVGKTMRSVLDGLGLKDVVGKCWGSSNPCNVVRATFNALKTLKSPKYIADKRGLKLAGLSTLKAKSNIENE